MKHHGARVGCAASFWSVTLMTIAACFHLSAQTGEHPQPVSTLTEVLNLAAEPKAEVDYVSVHRVLDSLSEAERVTALGRLIMGSNTGLATEAASRAIKARYFESADFIASRIGSWRSYEQVAVLSEIALSPAGFIEVPRALLRKAVQAAVPLQDEDIFANAVSLSSLLVANAGKPPDQELLKEVAMLMPRSWGIWMAMARAGKIDSPSSTLADKIYRDPTAPIAIRVAAATALAPLSPDAVAFATTEIQAFLAQFAGQELGFLLAGLREGADSKGEKTYVAYLSGFRMLSSLQVLKDGSVPQLVLRYLNSQNEEIRDLCGIVAARRWPEKLLTTQPQAFSDREYQHLLALVVRYHPELAGPIATKMTPAAMTKAQADIATIGPTFFSTPGNLLKFFFVP